MSPPVIPPVHGSPSVSRLLNIGERTSQDFTDYLWQVLIWCSDLSQLTEGLRTTFLALERGVVPAIVHKDNETSIAKLVRQSHASIAVFPHLSGLLPVELLADIGVHKIYKDLMTLFVDNRLCSQDQWETFFKFDDYEAGKVDRLVKKMAVLVQLHYCLEIVSIIDAFTDGQNLREITKNLLTSCKNGELKEGQVFSYPITAAEAVPEIKKTSAATLSRESAVRGHPTVECFLSEIPSTLGFLLVNPENESSIDSTISSDLQYHRFQTTAKVFIN